MSTYRKERNEYLFQNIFLFLVFILLTFIMTYPLSVRMDQAISSIGDPLFGTWVVAWDVHKLLELDFAGLFDANIFYPYKDTLAYADHTIESAIFALPVIVIFKNPVLGYNVALLMGMALSGFGMYLLASYLTGNRFAAFCAGLIYAFFPWRFVHIIQITLQQAQWIPFAFLYLHKFFDQRTYRNLFLFTFFFILQFLSCQSYGLFLALFAGMLVGLEFYRNGLPDKRSLYKLGLFVLISAISIGPFLYPYLKLKQEMGFVRNIKENIHYSADVLSYISVASSRVWRNMSGMLWKPEEFEAQGFFFGFSVLALALIGFRTQKLKREEKIGICQPSKDTALSLYLTPYLNVFLVSVFTLLIITLATKGNSFSIFGIQVLGVNAEKITSLVAVFLFLRLLLQRSVRRWLLSVISPSKPNFYLLVLISSFLFSLGPILHFHGHEIMHGPYMFLFKFVPGFDGMRVPARFIVMVVLAVSVFAAYGVAWMLERFADLVKKTMVTALLSLLILSESASIPLHTYTLPVGKDIPEVYQWLGGIKGDYAILELPISPASDVKVMLKQAHYMYYSIYHWKKLVNGYSAYFSPVYDFLRFEAMKEFPSDYAISFLQLIDVRYLIVHSADYSQREWQRVKTGIEMFKSELKPVKQCGEAYVYEIMRGNCAERNLRLVNVKEVHPGKWSVKASVGDHPERAIDGNLKTRWSTNRFQQPSDYFEIDMKEIRRISTIVLESGTDFLDFLQGYRVESSRDGSKWDIVKEEKNIMPCRAVFEVPDGMKLIISFPLEPCRFIRISQTGTSKEHFWSIREVRLFE